MSERLTKKTNECASYNIDQDFNTKEAGGYDINFGSYTLEELVEKLGNHEDIEDEYGIELTTLSKLLKQGFVYIRDGSSIEKNHGFIIDNAGLWSQVKLDPKKYGKKAPGGWALTKEELQ